MYPQFDEHHKYGLVQINSTQYAKCDSVPCCRRGNKRERRLAELEAEREES